MYTYKIHLHKEEEGDPITNKIANVPFHSRRDLKKGTFGAILKQAGIVKENWG